MPPTPGGFGFLLENGTDFILLEDDFFLLQEIEPELPAISPKGGRYVVIDRTRNRLTITPEHSV